MTHRPGDCFIFTSPQEASSKDKTGLLAADNLVARTYDLSASTLHWILAIPYKPPTQVAQTTPSQTPSGVFISQSEEKQGQAPLPVEAGPGRHHTGTGDREGRHRRQLPTV